MLELTRNTCDRCHVLNLASCEIVVTWHRRHLKSDKISNFHAPASSQIPIDLHSATLSREHLLCGHVISTSVYMRRHAP